MRGNNRRKIIITFPNSTEMEFDSITMGAKTLGVTNDCLNRALKNGHILSVPCIKIEYAE